MKSKYALRNKRGELVAYLDSKTVLFCLDNGFDFEHINGGYESLTDQKLECVGISLFFWKGHTIKLLK
jgi:hypothetical protein